MKSKCTAINNAACELAREVADEGAALVAGGITKTPSYAEGLGKDRCQKEFRAQTDIFVAHGVDFLIGEVNVPLITFSTKAVHNDMKRE